MARILVTGGTGFIGTAMCRRLVRAGHDVRPARRAAAVDPADQDAGVRLPDGDDRSAWHRLVADVDVVVHLAARAHVLREQAADPLGAFRAVNVALTGQLGRAAVAANVGRFVFLSSIGVHGPRSAATPISETSPLAPETPYAQSKLEAERLLQEIFREHPGRLTIIRPPLVYGPGAKGNLLQLLKVIERGLPLPLASLDNRRSMIGLDNLTELVLACIERPAAAAAVFVAADGEDISTPVLVRQLARALQHPARLFRCPPAVLRGFATLAGMAATYEQLAGDLVVDAGLARRQLGWAPVKALDEGLAEMAVRYAGSRA